MMMMIKQRKIKKPTTWKHESIVTVKVTVTEGYSSKFDNDVESG